MLRMEQKVRELIEKPLQELLIKVDEVEYVKEGSIYFLRIVIDKEPFVDIDTCVKASEIINPLIDVLDEEFDDSYVLDVCSKEKGDN